MHLSHQAKQNSHLRDSLQTHLYWAVIHSIIYFLFVNLFHTQKLQQFYLFCHFYLLAIRLMPCQTLYLRNIQCDRSKAFHLFHFLLFYFREFWNYLIQFMTLMKPQKLWNSLLTDQADLTRRILRYLQGLQILDQYYLTAIHLFQYMLYSIISNILDSLNTYKELIERLDDLFWISKSI